MAGKKRGIIERIMLGSEKSEGYARASLPSNRWELFWDLFKGRFWKLTLLNVLILLFFLPLFLLIIYRSAIITSYGATMPFAQGFGVGYQAPLSLVGAQEQVVLNVNLFAYLFLPLALIIAAVGVSGGAYVMRNIVWTEGVFVANDFWRGVKTNFKQVLLAALMFSVVFYLSQIAISVCDYKLATGEGVSALLSIAKILLIGFLILYSIMTMHMITMCVTYDFSFRVLLRNSFLFTVGLLPNSVLFLFLGLLPFLLVMLGGLFMAIGIILLILMGFSLLLLIWTNFSQWAYDRFINERMPGAKKNRGIYEKVKETNSEALKKYREQMAVTRTSLNSRPIKPITDDELKITELPTSFNREDILRLNESKQAIYDDFERYVEEHKNDPEFLPTKEELEAKEELAARSKRIEKAKKELMKRNKR